jgi:hypothetical protein
MIFDSSLNICVIDTSTSTTTNENFSPLYQLIKK